MEKSGRHKKHQNCTYPSTLPKANSNPSTTSFIFTVLALLTTCLLPVHWIFHPPHFKSSVLLQAGVWVSFALSFPLPWWEFTVGHLSWPHLNCILTYLPFIFCLNPNIRHCWPEIFGCNMKRTLNSFLKYFFWNHYVWSLHHHPKLGFHFVSNSFTNSFHGKCEPLSWLKGLIM